MTTNPDEPDYNRIARDIRGILENKHDIDVSALNPVDYECEAYEFLARVLRAAGLGDAKRRTDRTDATKKLGTR